MKTKKIGFIVLVVTLCIIVLGGIGTVIAEESKNNELTFTSSEEVDTRGLLVYVSVTLKGNGDGTMTATAKNQFTLGNTTLRVYVELYRAYEIPDYYTDMERVAYNYTGDLNIFDEISVTTPTGDAAAFWCARVRYQKDNDDWRSEVTGIFLFDMYGNKLEI